MVFAQQCPVEMGAPEAFQRIRVNAAIGSSISAEARNQPVADQNQHGDIGGAACFEKIENQGSQAIRDADALQHAENAQIRQGLSDELVIVPLHKGIPVQQQADAKDEGAALADFANGLAGR